MVKLSLRQSTRCRVIAKYRRILDRFSEGLHKLGVTGEDRASKLTFLALTTRFFNKPMSVVVKGQSSSGKSFVSENVLKFFPSDAYWELTTIENGGEKLDHRAAILSRVRAERN